MSINCQPSPESFTGSPKDVNEECERLALALASGRAAGRLGGQVPSPFVRGTEEDVSWWQGVVLGLEDADRDGWGAREVVADFCRVLAAVLFALVVARLTGLLP